MPDTELTILFGFTLTDLEYNRRGELSASQRQRLRRSIMLWSLLALAIFAPFVLVGAAMLLNSMDNSHLLLFVALIGVVIPVNFYFFAGHISNRYRDLVNNCVEQISGFVMIQPQRISTSSGSSTIYVLTVNWDTSFTIDEHIALNFPQGNYRLYYTPFSQTIVSAEAINHLKQVQMSVE